MSSRPLILRRAVRLSLLTFSALAGLLSLATAQDDAGEIRRTHRTFYSELVGDDAPTFGDQFGHAVAPLGDFDGDGIDDIAVLGVRAVWIVFLDEDDRPRAWKKIDLSVFGIVLPHTHTIAAIGDVNGDGVPDLAIGANSYNIPGSVLILFLAPDGSVLSLTQISKGLGGFGGLIVPENWFADSIVGLGDLDGDGVPDLAVSSPGPEFGCDAAAPPGVIWILFLRPDGTVKNSQPIGNGLGGLQATLDGCSRFGDSLSWNGRDRGVGAGRLAVGGNGTFWILTLGPLGTVTHEQELDLSSLGVPRGILSLFTGRTVTWLGDVNHDGVEDIAFARPAYEVVKGSVVPFSLWVVFLDADSTPQGYARMDGSQNGYTFPVSMTSGFPAILTSIPDRDGDGVREVLAGSWGFYFKQADQFAILYLNDGFTEVPWKISRNKGLQNLKSLARFGSSVTLLGDLTGDGQTEIAVGSPIYTFTGRRGTVRIVSLPQWGDASEVVEFVKGSPSLPAALPKKGEFGTSVAAVGDVDGDGVPDLLGGGPAFSGESGSAPLLLLNPDGQAHTLIDLGSPAAGFPGTLALFDRFGTAVAGLGDLDGDGVVDVAVGAPSSETAGSGAVWILFLTTNGTVKSAHKIAAGVGGFTGQLDIGDGFGSALAFLPPSTGGSGSARGLARLAVGAPRDDDGGQDRGAFWVLELAANGSVTGQRKVSQTSGGFPGQLHDDDGFGSALAYGPMTPGTAPVLAVGAPGDDAGGTDRGAVWILWPTHTTGLPDPFLSIRSLRMDASSVPLSAVDIDDGDAFGTSLAWLGDLDGNGTNELAVGTPGEDDAQQNSAGFQVDIGGVWIVCPALCRWSNLGLGLAGSNGIPQLVGRGSLVPGDEVELHLSDALPHSTAAIVAGTTRADIPFMGGVLVPRPDRVLLGLPVDGHGTHTYSQVWSAPLPQHVAYHFQYVVLDPAAPMGVATSNAVVARFP